MFGAFQTFGKLGAIGKAIAAAWSPLALWPNGASSPGMWSDGPSYPASCFQDSAGTTALSTIGTVLDSSNPVGLVLDRKAGATTPANPGIHLSQSTSAARPVASVRKNLLVGTATLSTQSVTVTAIPHTITFSGGGTVTASGTYSGALTSGQTFTPTAGTLTLTVSGSVTSAQLELGSTATSYQAVVSNSSYTTTGFPAYLKFDGVDDALASATFAAGTLTSSMDCLIPVRREASTNYLLYGLADTNVAGRYFGAPGPSILTTNKSYGNGVGSPTVWVDGSQITVAEGALGNALTVGSWHIMEYRGLDLSAWTKIVAWGFPSYFGNGGLGDIQLFASGQDANRDKARARMAAYFGVTLA